jgi:hypothetical protein
MEIWKKITNWENYYEASSIGNIKSIRSGKILKPYIDKKGYLTISLCLNSFQVNVLVHRIIADLFCEKTEERTCVNHKDGNKSNNHFLNLEWVTYSENNNHADITGLRDVKGSKHPNSKLNESDVLFIRNTKISRKELADKFSVSVALIQMIQLRKIWKHI